MVITASAQDRNSFGCSNEAQFTYFGKAYFDEALRTTDSFSEAYDRALPVIAEREKKEDYPPSMPQRRDRGPDRGGARRVAGVAARPGLGRETSFGDAIFRAVWRRPGLDFPRMTPTCVRSATPIPI